MATLFEMNYTPNFTEESFADVQKELEMRQKLRNKNFAEFREFIETFNNLAKRLPSQLQEKFPYFVLRCYDINREAWLSGMAQMYESIYHRLPTLLPSAILRVFKELKVPLTEKKLKEAVEFSVFTILKDEKLKGKQQKDVAKEWGKDEVYWSRVKNNSYARNYRRFLRQVVEHKRKSKKVSHMVEDKEDRKKSVKHLPETKYIEDRLTKRPLSEFHQEKQQERSQDWSIANKIVLEAMKKALKFLEGGGATRTSLQDFRKKVADEIAQFHF